MSYLKDNNDNFSNQDLSFSTNRSHNLANNSVSLEGGATILKGSTATDATVDSEHVLVAKNSNGTDLLRLSNYEGETILKGQVNWRFVGSSFSFGPGFSASLNHTFDSENYIQMNAGATQNGFWFLDKVFFDGKVTTQEEVGVGVTNPSQIDASAILEARSTTKGFLLPRMTTVERDAIATPTKSLMVFNTTTDKFNYHDGTNWVELCPPTTILGDPNTFYVDASNGNDGTALKGNKTNTYQTYAAAYALAGAGDTIKVLTDLTEQCQVKDQLKIVFAEGTVHNVATGDAFSDSSTSGNLTCEIVGGEHRAPDGNVMFYSKAGTKVIFNTGAFHGKTSLVYTLTGASATGIINGDSTAQTYGVVCDERGIVDVSLFGNCSIGSVALFNAESEFAKFSVSGRLTVGEIVDGLGGISLVSLEGVNFPFAEDMPDKRQVTILEAGDAIVYDNLASNPISTQGVIRFSTKSDLLDHPMTCTVKIPRIALKAGSGGDTRLSFIRFINAQSGVGENHRMIFDVQTLEIEDGFTFHSTSISPGALTSAKTNTHIKFIGTSIDYQTSTLAAADEVFKADEATYHLENVKLKMHATSIATGALAARSAVDKGIYITGQFITNGQIDQTLINKVTGLTIQNDNTNIYTGNNDIIIL